MSRMASDGDVPAGRISLTGCNVVEAGRETAAVHDKVILAFAGTPFATAQGSKGKKVAKKRVGVLSAAKTGASNG